MYADMIQGKEIKILKNDSSPFVQLEPRDTRACLGHSTNIDDQRGLVGQGNNPHMTKREESTIGEWIAPALMDTDTQVHQLSPRQQEPLTTLLASTTPNPGPMVNDLNLVLLCSPTGSGEEMIHEILHRLGSLIISGGGEAQGLIAPQVLDMATLEYKKSPSEIGRLLSACKDQLVEFRQQNPGQSLLLRDPYAPPILEEMRKVLGMRLIICLRPITEIAKAQRGADPGATIDAGIAHQLYGHLFSAITNSDIPFIMLRYSDMRTNGKEVVNALSRFCGLQPSQSQLDHAIHWLDTQCNADMQ